MCIYVYYAHITCTLINLNDAGPIVVINGISRCSHVRSIEYWVEALKNQSCTMWGTRRTLQPDFVVTYVYGAIEYPIVCRDVAEVLSLEGEGRFL